MKIFLKLIILLAFFSMGSDSHAGGSCRGGNLKSMSEFRTPKFKKYLDNKMISFSEKGINNTKEFSRISKCHKMVFGSKNKVKPLDAISLKRCQSMMKGDVAFQYAIKQPSSNIVKSTILDTKTDDQDKLEKKRDSEKISNNSSIRSQKSDESLQEESLFFD